MFWLILWRIFHCFARSAENLNMVRWRINYNYWFLGTFRDAWRVTLDVQQLGCDSLWIQTWRRLFNLSRTFMPALPKDVNLDPHDDSAWNLLLAAEDAVLNKDTKYLDELVGVRALGFFLLDIYLTSTLTSINILMSIKWALFHINVWSSRLYRVSRYR